MTLVELLLVLTILGTITALTLPGLKKHSQKTENAKLAQHTYSILEQALDMAISEDEEPIDKWDIKHTASLLLRDKLAKYVISVNNCTASLAKSNSCFSSYRSFKSDKINDPKVRALILPSGATIAGSSADSATVATFYIDVNNTNSPNMEGVDIFIFNFGKFDKNCKYSATGQWKLCPSGKAVDLVNDGWIINYWGNLR